MAVVIFVKYKEEPAERVVSRARAMTLEFTNITTAILINQICTGYFVAKP
tara:strand:+ start:1115 stop:1264 length:150 start_codon:yes stop_codon:yes gene_type:complete